MHIIKENVLNLEELNEFLARLPEKEFTKKVELLGGSTIGQHIRHILEFYISLKNCKTGEICYDDRIRDKRLENELLFAQHSIETLIVELLKIDEDQQLFVKANHSLAQDFVSHLKSSLFRELAYALDHSTHHLAIIKLALKAENVILDLPPNFGIAPSTVRHKLCAQ